MNPALRDLLESIRPADVVDVLLLSAFIFAAISWLRRSGSGSAARRMVALAVVFALVYALAGIFELYLMERLLRVLLIALLVAAVVVFQTDVRRLLDRVATWRIFSPSSTTPPSSTVEILTESAARLAADRTGALIALRGREPWTTHIQGGVELGGKVSRPLLESIFQTDSPGHDGAVLMEGEVVTRFAVHLPLATHLPEASRFGGTRHAAALGLAEECDALVIVVSEERGTISVAQDGVLDEMESATDLGCRLDHFWSQHYVLNARHVGRWLNRQSIENAAMSLALAMSVWMVFSYSGDTVYRSYDVPIEFRNLPRGWSLKNDTALTALVTLSGSDQSFRRLDPTQLVVSFDLPQPREGTNELMVTREQLRLPSGLRLYDVNPRELRVDLSRQRAAQLPVRIRTVGPLPDTLDLRPDPQRVSVLASNPAALPDQVWTEPIDLDRLPPSGLIRVRLVLPPGAHLWQDQPPEVEVQLVRRRGRRE